MTPGLTRQAKVRLDRALKGELGQATTETLMITGLMAALIVTVFTVMFWPSVSDAVGDLVSKISSAISGGGID